MGNKIVGDKLMADRIRGELSGCRENLKGTGAA